MRNPPAPKSRTRGMLVLHRIRLHVMQSSMAPSLDNPLGFYRESILLLLISVIYVDEMGLARRGTEGPPRAGEGPSAWTAGGCGQRRFGINSFNCSTSGIGRSDYIAGM